MYSQREVRRELVRVGNYNIHKLRRADYNLPKTVKLSTLKMELELLLKLREYRKKIKPPYLNQFVVAKFNRRESVTQKYIKFATFNGNYNDKYEGDMRYIADYWPKKCMALIRVDSWINYTKRYKTYVKMAGLVMKDMDDGRFRFLRVGPNVKSIEEALDYIKPAAVRRAEEEGKNIKRQGDIYFIPQRNWNLNVLRRTNHKVIYKDKEWDFVTPLNGEKVIISHATHGNLILETPHKALQQIIVANTGFGNGGGRISGHAD